MENLQACHIALDTAELDRCTSVTIAWGSEVGTLTVIIHRVAIRGLWIDWWIEEVGPLHSFSELHAQLARLFDRSPDAYQAVQRQRSELAKVLPFRE